MTAARKEKLMAVLAKRQGNLTVVLENVLDPHNVSAVMRTCDAVGIQDLYILNTRVARPGNWGFKSSSSASKWLTIHQFESAAGCFAALRMKYEYILAAIAGPGSGELYQTDLTRSTAIVFGNELDGITEGTAALCDSQVCIPQVGIIHSLNISVACAVVLYEGYRQKKNAGHYDGGSLPEPQKQLLIEQWNLLPDEQL